MYLIRENGSSLFELSYPRDFLLHCAYELQERTNERLFLLDFPLAEVNHISLSARDGTLVKQLLHLGELGTPEHFAKG